MSCTGNSINISLFQKNSKDGSLFQQTGSCITAGGRLIVNHSAYLSKAVDGNGSPSCTKACYSNHRSQGTWFMMHFFPTLALQAIRWISDETLTFTGRAQQQEATRKLSTPSMSQYHLTIRPCIGLTLHRVS
jgi:hypothetical protein